MSFALKRSWRDWCREAFIRQGLFSLRPLPENHAEAERDGEKRRTRETIRLELEEKPRE